MITFTKIKYEDMPEAVRKRVLNWSNKEITIDDTGLTAPQIAKITEFFGQDGFKVV